MQIYYNVYDTDSNWMEEDKMICSQCGLQMYEGSWVCPRCGHVLSEQPPYQNQGYAMQAPVAPAQMPDPYASYNNMMSQTQYPPSGSQPVGIPPSAIENFGYDPAAPAQPVGYAPPGSVMQPSGYPDPMMQPSGYPDPMMQQAGYALPPMSYGQQPQMQTQPYGQQPPYMQPQPQEPYAQPYGQVSYPQQAAFQPAPMQDNAYAPSPYGSAPGVPPPVQTPTPRTTPGDTGRIFLSQDEMRSAESQQAIPQKKKNKGIGWIIALVIILIIALALVLVFHFDSKMEFSFENIYTYYKGLVMGLIQQIQGMSNR